MYQTDSSISFFEYNTNTIWARRTCVIVPDLDHFVSHYNVVEKQLGHNANIPTKPSFGPGDLKQRAENRQAKTSGLSSSLCTYRHNYLKRVHYLNKKVGFSYLLPFVKLCNPNCSVFYSLTCGLRGDHIGPLLGAARWCGGQHCRLTARTLAGVQVLRLPYTVQKPECQVNW